MGGTLEVSGLTRSFGGVLALDRIDLSLAAGETLGLIGPNGSGKTSLFNLITGLYAPDRGCITLDGALLSDLPPARIIRRGVARTFQNLRLFRWLTVYENVRAARHANAPAREALWLSAADRRRERADVLHLLETFGLAHKAAEMPEGLTLAEQRRAELARALAAAPRLLLIDEPAAGMTPAETGNLAEILAHEVLPGRSVIFIEHKLDLVTALCPRIAVMNAGRKIADGPARQVVESDAVRLAYLGEEVAC